MPLGNINFLPAAGCRRISVCRVDNGEQSLRLHRRCVTPSRIGCLVPFTNPWANVTGNGVTQNYSLGLVHFHFIGLGRRGHRPCHGFDINRLALLVLAFEHQRDWNGLAIDERASINRVPVGTFS